MNFCREKKPSLQLLNSQMYWEDALKKARSHLKSSLKTDFTLTISYAIPKFSAQGEDFLLISECLQKKFSLTKVLQRVHFRQLVSQEKMIPFS